ncbi:MAG: hypothetical protein V4687_14815 [Bacteroidota bacterium]
MRYLAILLLVCSGALANAQGTSIKTIKPSKEEAEFIHAFFFDLLEPRGDTTYKYSTKIASKLLRELPDIFTRDTIGLRIVNGKRRLAERFLVLTPEEKAHIKAGYAEFGHLKWDDNILPEEKRLSMSDAVGMNITKPIFLRNNTLCIFEYDWSKEAALAIFKKVEGKWTIHIILITMHV